MTPLTTSHRVFYGISITTITVALVLGTYAIFQFLYPFKPAEYKGEVTVTNPGKILRPGEILRYEMSYCKYTKLPGYVSRQLVNSVAIPAAATTESVLRPGCRSVGGTFEIPNIDIRGEHRLVFTTAYRYSFLRTVYVQGETEPFTIISK